MDPVDAGIGTMQKIQDQSPIHESFLILPKAIL